MALNDRFPKYSDDLGSLFMCTRCSKSHMNDVQQVI